MAKNSSNDKDPAQGIPKLPHGQGNISWIPGRNKYLYKKSINGQRKSALGNTVKEVMAEMNRIEKESNKKTVVQKAVTLSDAMYSWLEIYKKPRLKKTSYDTLEKTIRSRIAAYGIGSMRLSVVDSDMIQKHLNMLNEEEHLSYSTVKKCYDALNDFYRNRLAGGKIEINPMQAVVMLNRENIIKETKKIEFFGEEDIRKFTRQAAAIRKWSKKPQYQYGFCLCANIFLGLRAGEILALKWKDVDFASRTVYVHENLQLVNNPGKKPAQVYETQSLKNYQNRTVRMNNSAKHFLELQKKYSGYTDQMITYAAQGTETMQRFLTCQVI